MNELFFPTQDEIELMHVKVIEETGGSYGLRDAGALESALKPLKIALIMKMCRLRFLAQLTLFICHRLTLLLTATNESRRLLPNCF